MNREVHGSRRVFNNDPAQRLVSTAGGLVMSATALLLIHGADARSVQGTDAEITRWFVTFLALLTLVSAVNAFLRTASLEVDADGIRYVLFGRSRRSIAWSDVKRIRIMQASPLASWRTPIFQYFVDATTEFRLPYTAKGPVFFTSRIERFPELASIVERQARTRGIPIIDQRPAR